MSDASRRNHMEYWCPAERAIYEASLEVEKMPAHVRLTDAVVLLSQARDAVADFVDEQSVTVALGGVQASGSAKQL